MEKKNNPLSEMMQESMAKVREMVDTNTIVGQPIETPDGVTLIPISRVSIGFGGGGTAFGAKKAEPDDPKNLGTAIGAGVKIDPVAFLIVKDGFTRPGGGDGPRRGGPGRQFHRQPEKAGGPAGGGALLSSAVFLKFEGNFGMFTFPRR